MAFILGAGILAEVARNDGWNLGQALKAQPSGDWSMASWVAIVQGTVGGTSCGG